tara:strand:- start:240 stop:590 length:351 start_codon:yes stop_codon:yes gene_type:complete
MLSIKKQKTVTALLKQLSKKSVVSPRHLEFESFTAYSEDEGGGYGAIVNAYSKNEMTISFYCELKAGHGKTCIGEILVFDDDPMRPILDLSEFKILMSYVLENVHSVFAERIIENL